MTDVTYNTTAQTYGWNRWAKMGGITVINHGDHVSLWPITSRGKYSNAALLQIPIDDVPAVIEALQVEMESVHRGMTSPSIDSAQDEESPEQMKERIKKRDDGAISEMENTTFTYREYMAIRRKIRIARRLNRAAIEENEVTA